MLRARYPATVSVRRDSVRLTHGAIHFREAGVGPTVVALHASPRSSLSLTPVMEALADRHRVIAPDTPGYGLSDPLPDDAPEMDGFVDTLRELLDGLGLRRVAVYGAHTGAALAMAFAARHPERVTALALDGVSAFIPAEIEDFRTRYLPPYAAAWDGSHVMGLWSRVRDLYTWFPWWDRTPERRLRFDPPHLDILQGSALGFLESGRHYHKAYIRAAAFQPDSVFPALPMPVTIFARPDDLIADHLQRLKAAPPGAIRNLGPSADEWRAALVQALALGEPPDEAASQPPALEGSRFVSLGGGALHVRLAGPVDGPVRLLLPGLPGDAADLVARETVAHPDARLIALDSPGCGLSDPLLGEAADLAALTAVLSAALAALGVEQPTSLAGEGASAVLARLWRAQAGWPLQPEAIDPPSWLRADTLTPTEPLLQPLALRWDGAHLLGAWFQVRDLLLYDVPPGAGTPVRGRCGDALDLTRLERLFLSVVRGPECAEVLAALVAHVAREKSVSDQRPMR